MTYGTKQLKNGKARGYIVFDSGKQVALNARERADFENKIRYWEQCALEKRDADNGRYIPIFDRQGDSKSHNCMQSAFCETCGLKI
jgi:hypothetical protein